jgi:hypothetical protein
MLTSHHSEVMELEKELNVNSSNEEPSKVIEAKTSSGNNLMGYGKKTKAETNNIA